MTEETDGGKRRTRKPKEIADDVLDAHEVAEGRREPEDAALEPTVAPDDVEAAMVTEHDAGARPASLRRIRWLQGNQRGKCSLVGYKLAHVQIALQRAEYADLEK